MKQRQSIYKKKNEKKRNGTERSETKGNEMQFFIQYLIGASARGGSNAC